MVENRPSEQHNWLYAVDPAALASDHLDNLVSDFVCATALSLCEGTCPGIACVWGGWGNSFVKQGITWHTPV